MMKTEPFDISTSFGIDPHRLPLGERLMVEPRPGDPGSERTQLRLLHSNGRHL